MGNILKLTSNLKIIYLILIILIMIIINIILNKKQINSNYKYLINGISLTTIALLTSHFNDIIEGIFNLNFLSVKLYIVVLIITNIITLITIQKKIKPIYKIINYLLFVTLSIILGIILITIFGTKLNIFPQTTNQYTISLLNVSIIIFIIYLTIISALYIIKNIKNVNLNINIKKINKPIEIKLNIKERIQNLKLKNIFKKKEIIKSKKETKVLTPEELLTFSNKEEFNINGVECGIIFEDSIPENIIKNYHILLEDINAKLVNGYTLEENKLLKSIFTKLDITNLNYIDINNLSILNKISIEEYNLLKKIYEE